MATPMKLKILSHLQATYNFTGEYPDFQQLKLDFVLTNEELHRIIKQLNDPISSTTTDSLLTARGLPEYELPEPVLNPKVKAAAPVGFSTLDPHFVTLVDLVLDVYDKRSLSVKAKHVGWSTQKWNAALKKKENKQYYAARMQQLWGDIEHISQLSLVKAAEAGDLQSIKYALELSGTYRPNQELLLNVGVLVAKIMEVLTKYVEPGTLQEIANEMETLGVGSNIALNSSTPSFSPNPLIEGVLSGRSTE